jgi:hypothetical protein
MHKLEPRRGTSSGSTEAKSAVSLGFENSVVLPNSPVYARQIPYLMDLSTAAQWDSEAYRGLADPSKERRVATIEDERLGAMCPLECRILLECSFTVEIKIAIARQVICKSNPTELHSVYKQKLGTRTFPVICG